MVEHGIAGLATPLAQSRSFCVRHGTLNRHTTAARSDNARRRAVSCPKRAYAPPPSTRAALCDLNGGLRWAFCARRPSFELDRASSGRRTHTRHDL
eukprot:1327812-Prymnesium_polylepis.1